MDIDEVQKKIDHIDGCLKKYSDYEMYEHDIDSVLNEVISTTNKCQRNRQEDCHYPEKLECLEKYVATMNRLVSRLNLAVYFERLAMELDDYDEMLCELLDEEKENARSKF